MKFDLENFPTSPSAVQMLGYVSQGFYDKSYVGKWLYQVMGLEYDAVLEIVESLPEQFFPETATWGLMYHEIKWGLPVRENLSYEERRRLIYEKRDLKAPMTPYRMEQYLKTITGHEVHIADVNDPGDYGFVAAHPNTFKAYFVGNETLDSKQIRAMLDRLKQSHTTYQVNHLITVEIDNQNIENVILRRVRFRMTVSFFGCYVFDGSWSFDGSVLLNARCRYGLVLGLKQCQGKFYASEQVDPVSVKLEAKIGNEETSRSRVRHCCGIHHAGRNTVSFTICPEVDFSDQETIELTVETKTADHWNFDGSELLDGRKQFNSVYRKERVE